jgi:hypothetical protein
METLRPLLLGIDNTTSIYGDMLMIRASGERYSYAA